MSIGPLIGIAGNYIESLFSNPALSNTTSSASSAGAPAAGAASAPDSNAVSPFAQVLSSLQQLAESNPSQYQHVTQQISANLQSAAQTATTNGDTSLAAELNKLSGDFGSASGTGQLPNIQDLAQAIGGGHHHFHHHQAAAPGGGPADTTTTASGSVNQLLQALSPSQAGTLASNSLSPLNIIDSTLSAAGVSGV